ncbi:type IX secretion system ring subunit PorN/GldN [Mucilaginibacter myungsuensis]|uniref:Gliding motility protein GldN n=1 Tax=Mucilaginibacter myungsuensis TaxID=649104 RepID=A0A929L691_9SPHI|nr:gliding motility protein GldN [Mucilaginibacter myungsuensis]MBE9663961.1 gliding motility protein GldN [Mucilaginibacter myungsuensis]MDN3598323.1 gliding motility protein GldN [Mucilaginibacter myungsuensis]
MKKQLFIVGLCLLSVSAFAQKGKTTTKKATPTKKTNTAAKKPAAKPTTLGGAGNAGNGGAGQSLTDTLPKNAKLTDTTAFERPMDGYFKKATILSAKVTPYAPLREADIAMKKRVWREIDTREKLNNYLSSPKARLIDVLLEAIKRGELTAYDPTPNPDPKKEDPDGDAFATPLSSEAALAKLSESTLVEKRDADNNVISSKLEANPVNPDSIIRFRIKEDWLFDKQRSVWEPRIIGIAPLVKPKTNFEGADFTPAFWIHFPSARDILAHKEVVVQDNDATGLSFDDIFMKRIFASYIVKVSNNKNERIRDNYNGLDRLYESERLKKQLMDWELDLWQY